MGIRRFLVHMCNFKLCMMMIKYFLDFYFFKAFFLQKLDIVAELLRLLLLFFFWSKCAKNGNVAPLARHFWKNFFTFDDAYYFSPSIWWAQSLLVWPLSCKKELNIVNYGLWGKKCGFSKLNFFSNISPLCKCTYRAIWLSKQVLNQ